MSILRASAAALVFALLSAGATSARSANAPVLTPADLPSGGASYGVSDHAPQFQSASGTGAGSVFLGYATAGAAPGATDVFVSGSIGAGTAETGLDASANLTVNFYINGAAGARVPITIQGEAAGSASGDGVSSAGAFLETFGSNNAATLFSFTNCNTTNCGGAFAKTFNLPTGVIFSVLLEAGGAFINNPTDRFSGPGAFSASVDPPSLISIDPTFAAQNPGFSLAINSGSAAPGVPEPSAWALMIAGFGAAGAALRRRRAEAETGRRRTALA